ncbi:MAG: hypothetical protein EBS19_04300 [Spirochaetia bacterium]|nr:hypothetical protein [Spirochaetia bacterium]
MKKLKVLSGIMSLSLILSCSNLGESSSNDLILIAANLPATASCSKSNSSQCLNISIKSIEKGSYCINNGYIPASVRCSDLSAGKCTYTSSGNNIVAFYGTDFTAETAQADCESISGGVYSSE